MLKLTHSELIELCKSYAVKRNAVLVSSEIGDREKPDVFALYPDGSTTVFECKATRSDFKADLNKKFRQDPLLGMGDERIFVVNEGVCRINEVPEGWKLAVATDIDKMEVLLPSPLLLPSERKKFYSFEAATKKELMLIAHILNSNMNLIPENTFPVKVSPRPLENRIKKIFEEKGRCPFCKNKCHKNKEESIQCPDFHPKQI